MDMQTKQQDQLIFHLTGQRQGAGVAAIAALDLRPALLAPYRDLAALRHDFPVVLAERGGGADFVRSLSSLVDAVLKDVAPRGIEGERLRRHALQLEHEIRRAVDEGVTGSLGELWDQAAARLGAREGEALEQVLVQAGSALQADGEVLGCTRELPARLITHAWQAARRVKARRFHADLNRLVVKLSDILRAAFSHSQAGRQPQSLQASVGGPHREQFDFDALSRIVGKGVPRDELPAARRARLDAHAGRAGVAALLRPARPGGRSRRRRVLRFRVRQLRRCGAGLPRADARRGRPGEGHLDRRAGGARPLRRGRTRPGLRGLRRGRAQLPTTWRASPTTWCASRPTTTMRRRTPT